MNKLFKTLTASILGLVLAGSVCVGLAFSRDVCEAAAADDYKLLASGTSSWTQTGYGTNRSYTDDANNVWHGTFGQPGYLGENNDTNYKKALLTSGLGLEIAKGYDSSVTNATLGYRIMYCDTEFQKATKIEFSTTAKATSAGAVYLMHKPSGSTSWSKVTLKNDSPTSQGSTTSTTGAFTKTFTFDVIEKAQYAILIYKTAACRITAPTFSIYALNVKDQTITASEDSTYVGNGINLTTNADSATWSITEDTAGASLTSTSGKSTTVNATKAGSVTIKAVSSGYNDATKTVTFIDAPTVPYITPSKTSTSGYTGLNETIGLSYGNLTGVLSASSSTSAATAQIQNDDGMGNADVLINFVSAGSSIISLKDGDNALSTITVTITASSVTITGLPATDKVNVNKTLDLGSTITVNATGSYSDEVSWSSDDSNVASVNSDGIVTGVSVGTAVITVAADSDPDVYQSCTLTVSELPLESTYDLTKNFETYAKEWGGYAVHTVTGKDVDADFDATITFSNVSKQAGTITNMPVIAAKSGTTSTMSFVLDSALSSKYTINEVNVAFTQWTSSKKVAAAIYKGTTVSGDPLDSFADSSAINPIELNVNKLNGDSFIVDFTTSSTSNQQLGVSSIFISLAKKSSFGTLDHIKVTSLPQTVYHVGESFDSTGLTVTAYDNADESLANYKDVTADIETNLVHGYVFDDTDIPGIEVEVSYEETIVARTTYYVSVYALAEYKLVETAPDDWSGNYLIVASFTDADSNDHTVAINSTLVNFDVPLNFKEVTESNGVITAGQECEFKFASYSSGYSAQGKNGKYVYGNSTNRFMTSETPRALTLSISSKVVTIKGEGSYQLRLNTGTIGLERFGFYDTGTVNIYLYKLSESSGASDYADKFLAAGLCDGGTTAPSTTKWNELAADYALLNKADQELFRLGVPSQTGTNIQQCLARYDYIVSKYGKATYSDFMNRDPQPLAGSLSSMNNVSNSTMMIVIVSVAVASISLLGVTIFLKKKRAIH